MKKLIVLFLLLAGMSFGQVSVAPFTTAQVQFFDASGVVCAGCQLSTFSAGTTTPLATYSDLGVSLNSNPIVMDSAGVATIYLTNASYKFVLKKSVAAGGATIRTVDNISWSTPLTTFAGITDAGALTQTQPTAATGGANQSSFTDCMNGTYWTGAVSATDSWCLQDILGTGTNPTSTFTLTHSGSSGTSTFSVPGNQTIGGTLGVTGTSTLGVVNAGATSTTSLTNTGDTSLSTGKVIKWNSDTGFARDAAGVVDVGNGTQGDKSGNVKLATLTLGKSDGTLPATIANDTAGGILFTNNAGGSFQFGNGGTIFLNVLGGGIRFSGATSGTTVLAATAIAGGGTLSLPPNVNDTLVAKTTTDTLTNKTLTGATSGNNISVLNAQGAVGALTGNSADQVVYTYSLPANTVDTTSKGILITCGLTHNSGTANPSVKININGVAAVTGSIGTSASQSVTTEAKILRTASTTGGSIGKATSAGNLVPFTQALAGLAWTSSQTITCTFNVANTDQMTGVGFFVEQIQ